MILGSFNFEDMVYIDSKEGITRPDVYAHELTHYTITQNSMVGILMLALKQVAEQRDFKLQHALKELHDASIVTQEMTAMYAQYMTYMIIHGGVIDSEYEVIFKTSDYYKKYCLESFDVLINNPQEEDNGLYSLIQLAIVAMNVDYSEIRAIDWTDSQSLRKTILEAPLKYLPDYRYRKLVDTWAQQIRCCQQKDIEKIVAEAGIHYIEVDHDNVTTMISRLCYQLSKQCNLSYDDLFGGVVQINFETESSKEFDTEEIAQRIIPKVLNRKVRFPNTKIDLLNNWVQTAFVALNDKHMENWGIKADDRVIDILLLHHSIAGWHYPVFTERKATAEYIVQFPGEVISFYEDFDRFRLEIPLPTEKRVFYLFDGQWQRFVKWVHSLDMKYVYIHQINQDVYCIFATNYGHDVCFTIQSALMLQYIFKSIDDGDFTYVNLPQKQNIDGIFYQTDSDWYRFEDVIASTLNITMIDNPNGSHIMGRRVFMDE